MSIRFNDLDAGIVEGSRDIRIRATCIDFTGVNLRPSYRDYAARRTRVRILTSDGEGGGELPMSGGGYPMLRRREGTSLTRVSKIVGRMVFQYNSELHSST
uniref:Uncharacterized protein n=1 Tax=Hyaloperonospora arabidopsidis (strain Emoy2) TaxID=559515 RepID=M4BLI4_HYAAE